jgi:hypothetical protein
MATTFTVGIRGRTCVLQPILFRHDKAVTDLHEPEGINRPRLSALGQRYTLLDLEHHLSPLWQPKQDCQGRALSYLREKLA